MPQYLKQLTRLLVIIIPLANLWSASHLYAQSDQKSDSLLGLLHETISRKEKIKILNEIAHELRRSHPDSAISFAEQALRLSIEENDSLGMADAYFETGMVHRYQFHIDEARDWLLKSYGIFLRLGYDDKVGQTANQVGITYGIQGAYDRAGKYFNEGLAANLRTGDKTKQAECYNNLGNVFKYKGDYVMSVEYYQEALDIYKELADSAGIGQIYNHLGIIYDYQGNYRQSLEHYFDALRILENTDDLEDIASVTGNIGVAYYYLKDYKKALEYANRQLTLEEQLGDKRGLAIVLNNIGQYHENLGNLNEALDYNRQSLEYKKELGLQEGIASSYHNIGNIYSKLERYQEALEYHETSLGMREEMDHAHGIAMSLVSTASVHRHMGNFQKSNSLALKAFKMSEELGSPMFRQGASNVLADNYSDLGRYREAFYYQKVYQETSDSLNSEANIKKVTQLEMQYEFDKLQQEKEFQRQQEVLEYEGEVKRQKILAWTFIGGFILVIVMGLLILRGYYQKRRANTLLAEQKEEIQTMNDQLQDSLGEKEILLKEIHHRVKNNLQIISSLLSLQSRDISDETVKDAVKEGQSRVKSMALIHQMLYQSEQISRIRFGEYLDQLTSSLASMYQSKSDIICKTSADGIDLDIDTAIPLGLIINELVSNSYKYAFAGRASGRITVDLQSEGDAYRLTVSDDGIGMPEEIELEKSKSLGIRLVNILVSQLNGRLERDDGQGTTFYINFNEPNNLK